MITIPTTPTTRLQKFFKGRYLFFCLNIVEVLISLVVIAFKFSRPFTFVISALSLFSYIGMRMFLAQFDGAFWQAEPALVAGGEGFLTFIYRPMCEFLFTPFLLLGALSLFGVVCPSQLRAKLARLFLGTFCPAIRQLKVELKEML